MFADKIFNGPRMEPWGIPQVNISRTVDTKRVDSIVSARQKRLKPVENCATEPHASL